MTHGDLHRVAGIAAELGRDLTALGADPWVSAAVRTMLLQAAQRADQIERAVRKRALELERDLVDQRIQQHQTERAALDTKIGAL